MPLNIDRVIRLSFGVGLGLLSISGLRCLNSYRSQPSDTCVCDDETESTSRSGGLTCFSNRKYSKINMNLIASGLLGVASGFIIYRNYRIYH